jgi:hypothetical protein
VQDSEYCEKCRGLSKEWERAQKEFAHRAVLSHLSQADLLAAQAAARILNRARDSYFEHRATHTTDKQRSS